MFSINIHSINVNGKVLDYNYKRLTTFSYAFYIGDMLMGQVFNMGKTWSCTAQTIKLTSDQYNIFPVNGFKNRFYASQFLLKYNGYLR